MDQILLVEDDVALRNALLRCLTGQPNTETRGTGTLREAVASLDLRTPDLIVLDVELPDGSGFELLPELAKRSITAQIVVITAHSQRFQSEFPDKANIDVLAKPFEISDFKQLVVERLARAKSKAQAPAFTVSDYLQLAGMARRSIVLTVSDGTRPLGKVIVQDGAPRWAEDHLGEGEAAFRRLAMLPSAEVSCRPLEVPTTKANLSGSLEQLLLNAAREADEGTRRSGTMKQVPEVASENSESPGSSPSAAPVSVRAPISVPPIPPPLPMPRARAVPPKPVPTTRIGLGAFQPKTAGATQRAEENVVSLTKSTTPNLAELMALDPTIKAAARSDRQGSVLEMRGEMDAETTCAVVNMAARQIVDATAELGLGRPSAWHVSVGASTWYVVQAREELVISLGTVHKSPIATLKKLVKGCGVNS